METNPIAIMYLSSPSPPSSPPISPPSPPPVSPKELQCCAALVTLSSMLDRCSASPSYPFLQPSASSPSPISLPVASDSFKLTLPRHTDLSALIPSPPSSCSWKPRSPSHTPSLSPNRQNPQCPPLFSLFDTHSDFQWRSLPPPIPPRNSPTSSSPNTSYLLPPRARIQPPSPPSPPLSLSPPASPFSPCHSPYSPSRSPSLPSSPPFWPESEEKKRKREEARDPWYSEEVPLRRTCHRESRQRREEERAEVMRRERDMIRREREEEAIEEEEEEIEPDFTRSGAQVLVCRRTNACPLHRTRKKRCPANCEFRKTSYTSNYAKRCVNTKARVGRCAMLDAYLCKYNQSAN
eukprot:Phypoly_transcript_12436.p1 GENE.Phypoly_transcript_12436~~Phypoly_transcript_12436.p1  ORF type:complete len:350 (+),score=85.43 Phypoly_transcript_12436:74-1123(+)